MLSWIRRVISAPPTLAIATPDHLKLEVLKRDIPRYPPFMKGLPTETPEDLLAVQGDMLDQIRDAAGLARADFDRLYFGAILRFTQFVHLLPASQSHHHRGAGGLLRHSLEVALWSLRAANKMVLLDLCKTPAQKREIEPRWLLTAFLAGLCHDIGKPASDVSVRNHESTTQWVPVQQSLWAWAQEQGIDAYFLEWQEGRGKRHVTLANMLATRIITEETLTWIAKESDQLLVWLTETLSGNPGNRNPLFEIVIKMDQKSVERDLKSMGAAMAGYDLGVPVERMLSDIMRSFVRQGLWSVNEPGAKVWVIDGDTYLVWPTSGQDIAKQVVADRIAGVPRSVDAVMDMLVERNLAFLAEDGLYKIAPAILKAKIPDIKLHCIRLRDDTLVSANPLSSVEGQVLGKAQEESEELAQSKESLDPAVAADPAKSSQALSQTAATKQAPLFLVDQDTGEILTPQTAQPKPSSKQEEKTPAPARSMPVTAPAQVEEKASVAPLVQDAVPQIPPKELPTKPRSLSAPALVLDGVAGEVLKAVADDLRSGVKRWGEHAIEQADGRIMLKWPDAFAGYGLTPSAIIGDLTAKDWCM